MKTTSIFYRARSLFLGLFAAAVICTGAAGAPAQQRPIEDFVSAQGTFFGDPFAILFWTAPEQGLFTVVDYAAGRKVYQGDRKAIGMLLIDSMQGVNASANAEYYAHQIAERAAKRERLNGAKALTESIEQNVVHGSDSLDTAAQEVSFFFSGAEICPRTR